MILLHVFFISYIVKWVFLGHSESRESMPLQLNFHFSQPLFLTKRRKDWLVGWLLGFCCCNLGKRSSAKIFHFVHLSANNSFLAQIAQYYPALTRRPLIFVLSFELPSKQDYFIRKRLLPFHTFSQFNSTQFRVHEIFKVINKTKQKQSTVNSCVNRCSVKRHVIYKQSMLMLSFYK